MTAIRVRRIGAGAFLLCVVIVCGGGCTAGRPNNEDAAALRDVLRISGEVFELTDWNSSQRLDHLQLLSDPGDVAFDAQTAALRRNEGGYLCAGMATYLGRALSRRGYRNLTYNSGAGEWTHVITLVELGDHLYVIDVFAGSVAKTDSGFVSFETFLRSLIDSERPAFDRLFQPIDPALRKSYFYQLSGEVHWPTATADELSQALKTRVTVTRRQVDGTLDLDLDDPGRGFSDCHLAPSGRLACQKAAPDYPVYDAIETGIQQRTGVAYGLFRMPLNLHSDDLDYFVAKYRAIEVLTRYAPEFQALDMMEPPDRQAYGRLVGEVTRDVRAALAAHRVTTTR